MFLTDWKFLLFLVLLLDLLYLFFAEEGSSRRCDAISSEGNWGSTDPPLDLKTVCKLVSPALPDLVGVCRPVIKA